jgi:hypothetical protein
MRGNDPDEYIAKQQRREAREEERRRDSFWNRREQVC